MSESNITAWTYFSSAWGGGSGISGIPLPANGPTLVVDDITPLLNATPPSLRGAPAFGDALPFRVIRSYETAPDSNGADGAFIVRINITALEDTRLGGFGFSQISDEFIGGDLDTIARVNSLIDPHLGGDHGYTEWIRMTGNESLLATPATSQTSFEAWRPIMEDCNYGGWEHEWLVLSAAWAHEGEWGTQRQAPNQMSMAEDLVALGIWGPNPLTPIPAWRGGQVMNLSGMAARYFNPPTFVELKAGEHVSYALRYSLAPNGPRTTPQALITAGEPSLRSVPGYTIGSDSNSSYLLITLPTSRGPPTGASVTPPGILSLSPSATLVGTQADGAISTYRFSVSPTGGGVGRARAAISLPDGSQAIAHYHVTPPFASQVAAVGSHWAQQAWLPRDYPDPFGRSASVMPWDREDGGHVLDDSRAYIVGLSDDAGAAQHLGFSSKVACAPTSSEVSRLDEYIDNTLYGVKPDVAKPPFRSLQTLPDSPEGPDHIRMTVYYYCDSPGHCTSANGHFNYSYPMQDHCDAPVGGPNWCMTENMANATYRGYNYPHSTSVWLAQYRVARNWDLLGAGMSRHWSQYLARAVALAGNVGQASVGFMDGTVFRELLNVLCEETAFDPTNTTLAGWRDILSANMLARAEMWATQDWPYGSEFAYVRWVFSFIINRGGRSAACFFTPPSHTHTHIHTHSLKPVRPSFNPRPPPHTPPQDTTGQEEVFIWLNYFANSSNAFGVAANRTLEAVLGYMRHLPNAFWHAGGRSGGDLGNNGKWYVNRGQERLLQHYRAGLNAIPLIEAYRANPDDSFLLSTAMGALLGGYGSILPSSHPVSPGAVSMGFHTAPFALEYDPRSGDFGLGFFGVTLEAGAYLVTDPELPAGWACYMCNLGSHPPPSPSALAFSLTDGYRVRVYLEPLGLYLVAQTGVFAQIALDFAARTASITFDSPLAAPAAPTPHKNRPFSFFRLKLIKLALNRPGSSWTLTDAAGSSLPIVRGCYQIAPPTSDADTTTITLKWS